MDRTIARVALITAVVGACNGTLACSADSITNRLKPTATAQGHGERAAPLAVGGNVWVDVSVATLWASPSAPRPIDAPALRDPVDIPAWLAAMDTDSRRGLVGRVETQALLGERLIITGVRKMARLQWLHVVAVAQKTHRDSRGYPGWLPARQVTTTRPTTASRVATVVRPTAWLRDQAGRRVLRISIATRLPVVATSDHAATVTTPRGALRSIAATAVVVRRASTPDQHPSATEVTSTAGTLIGVPYLWGGRSGFAVDCSGFTQLVFKLRGVDVPRDADDQASAGRVVSGRPHEGDLVFFHHPVSHVGLVIGPGRMEHAPHSGSTVRYASIASAGRTVAVRSYL